MLAEALVEAPGSPTSDLKRCSQKHRGSTCQEMIAEGSVWKQDDLKCQPRGN